MKAMMIKTMRQDDEDQEIILFDDEEEQKVQEVNETEKKQEIPREERKEDIKQIPPPKQETASIDFENYFFKRSPHKLQGYQVQYKRYEAMLLHP
jgi:hypothetical protein